MCHRLSSEMLRANADDFVRIIVLDSIERNL